MANEMNRFKGQERGQRIQTSDSSFAKGMYYSNMPLQEGFVKELVNYDTKEQGTILIPRPGLRTVEHAVHTGGELFDPGLVISYAKECAEENNKVYKQVILGKLGEAQLEGTQLTLGEGYVGTVKEGELSLEPLHTEGESLLFKRPSTGEIHGTPVTDLPTVGKQVGTFAYNDDFYFFKDDKKLYRTDFDDITETYKPVVVTPRAIDAKEATMWGYNMLSIDPYTFADGKLSANIQFGGLVIYDATDAVSLSPLVNEPVKLRAQYDVVNDAKYTIVWEWKEFLNPTWETIETQVVTFEQNTVLEVPFSSPASDIILRVSAYRWVGEVVNTAVDQVLQLAISFRKTMLGDSYNIQPVIYDLSTATGMTYWRQRLVVYGIKENKTMIFLSDPDDPSYFPFPNNIDVFDEPIIHVTSIKEELLVFTTSKIHALTLSLDGLSWTRKLLQDKLSINEWDTDLIQNIKNMVYFRSGNYYYMIVPSARLVGNLTVAPISKNMEDFFNNFQSNVTALAVSVYDYLDPLTLVNYYNYLDFEDVCNVYVYQTTKGVYLNFVLLYNSLLRSWRCYFYESQSMIAPYKQDVTRRGQVMSLFEFNGKPAVQILEHSANEVQDYYIPTGLIDITAAPTVFETVNVFKNYQYIDTGYREISSTFKKRFREVQVKFHNVSGRKLNFYSEFLIDGELRKSQYKYNVHHNTDPQDPDYGVITMVREFVDPFIVPGTTILAETEEDLNLWELDVSVFPELSLWKVRLPVSGKGYTPRLRLISYNDTRYEILDLNWVFRPLYSR